MLFPNADDVILVSIGTHQQRPSLDLSDTKRLGLAGWTRHALNFNVDGQSQTVHDELTRLLPPIGSRQRYYRFEATVPQGKMDDASVANLEQLHTPDRQRGCMTDDHQTSINAIRARTTVLNERVVWGKTGVLVLEAELMRQQTGSTKTEPLISHLSLTSH